jgi:hypothetical protein
MLVVVHACGCGFGMRKSLMWVKGESGPCMSFVTAMGVLSCFANFVLFWQLVVGHIESWIFVVIKVSRDGSLVFVASIKIVHYWLA